MNWPTLLRSLPGYDPYRDADGCWFDEATAQLYLDFFPECLRHVEGSLAGKPFVLEPWQQSFIANLMGWKTKDLQGREVRRYREAFLYVPRKNGKTPLVAGLAIAVYFLDNELGQQNEIAAESREQAGKLFRHMRGMIEREQELLSRCRVYGGTAQAGQSKSIVRHDDPVSYTRIVAADDSGQHGSNLHLGIIDELHTQPNRDLVDAMQTSMASENRRNPLLIEITTADFLRESICNEKYDYACRVRDGIIKDRSFLPAIYEALPEEDWTAEAVWRRVNPNLGISVSLDYLRRECARAKETPAYENTFRRLHLNQRTSAETKWLSDVLWMTPPNGEPFDLEILKDQTCWGGLDFGWRDDYASFVLVFNIEGVYYVRCWFWLPREGGRKKHLMPTAEFISRGLVELTPGDSTDVNAIYKVIREARDLYDLRDIAFDPSNAMKQGQDLINEGFQVFEFYQSKKNYNEPCQVLVALLKEGKLRHGGDRVLRWQASNVQIEENGLGQIMPKKKRSMEKIDGICALTMALGRAQLAFTEVPEITFL